MGQPPVLHRWRTLMQPDRAVGMDPALDFAQPQVNAEYVQPLATNGAQPALTLNDGRLNALDLAAPVALYCGVDGMLEVYDIGANGQGTLAFSLPLADLIDGEFGLGMGSRLALLDGGQAELFSLDLMSAYTFRFDPAACAGA